MSESDTNTPVRIAEGQLQAPDMPSDDLVLMHEDGTIPVQPDGSKAAGEHMPTDVPMEPVEGGTMANGQPARGLPPGGSAAQTGAVPAPGSDPNAQPGSPAAQRGGATNP
ncbi:MAG: hypothetical protein NVSMB21_25510 [Vulcanimicrobiaceae bacterium]